jgi:hypothetical protein
MNTRSKYAVVLAVSAAVAMTAIDIHPAAAQAAKPNAAVTVGDLDVSAAKKKRRVVRRNSAVPLAAFGAILGTIGTIAAAERQREYERQYYGPPAYTYGPGYYPAQRHYYRNAPVYQPRAYHHAPRVFTPRQQLAPLVHPGTNIPRYHGPNIVNGHWQPPRNDAPIQQGQ